MAKKEIKKKSKVMKTILIIVAIVIILPMLVLGYLGFVPGVSALFGSSAPKDLGVKYTAADFASVQTKMGSDLRVLSPNTAAKDSIKYSGTKRVTTALTSAELTAAANSGKWKYHMVQDVQIKVSPDGTVEMSGKILKDKASKAATAYGFNDNDLKKAEDTVGFIPGNPRFYAKGKASVINNQVHMDIEQLEIGRINAKNLITADQASSILHQGLATVPGLSINSLTFDGGKMNFDGTLPQTTYRVTD